MIYYIVSYNSICKAWLTPLSHRRAVFGNCGASEKVRKTCNEDELPELAEVAEDGEPKDWAVTTCACLHVLLQTADKAPKYKNDAAMSEAKMRYRILCRKFRQLDILIDKNKYFGISESRCLGSRATTLKTFRTPLLQSRLTPRKSSRSPKRLSTPFLAYFFIIEN